MIRSIYPRVGEKEGVEAKELPSPPMQRLEILHSSSRQSQKAAQIQQLPRSRPEADVYRPVSVHVTKVFRLQGQ